MGQQCWEAGVGEGGDCHHCNMPVRGETATVAVKVNQSHGPVTCCVVGLCIQNYCGSDWCATIRPAAEVPSLG